MHDNGCPFRKFRRASVKHTVLESSRVVGVGKPEGTFRGEMAADLRRNLPVLSLAARTSQRLISQPLLRFKSDTPPVVYGQAAACPRAAQKSATYRVSVSYSGSAGAVGRHKNIQNRVAFGSGPMSTRSRISRLLAVRVPRIERRKPCRFERHNDRSAWCP